MKKIYVVLFILMLFINTDFTFADIELSVSDITLHINEKAQLNVTGDNIDELIWTSSDISIATVTDGIIKGIAPGTVTISVTDDTSRASCKVTVVEGESSYQEEEKEDPLVISIEDHEIDFKPEVTDYKVLINNEEQLNFKINRDDSQVTISGNRNLTKGSIVTVTIQDKGKTTYIFNITKKTNSRIYLIGIIAVLIVINIARIITRKK